METASVYFCAEINNNSIVKTSGSIVVLPELLYTGYNPPSDEISYPEYYSLNIVYNGAEATTYPILFKDEDSPYIHADTKLVTRNSSLHFCYTKRDYYDSDSDEYYNYGVISKTVAPVTVNVAITSLIDGVENTASDAYLNSITTNNPELALAISNSVGDYSYDFQLRTSSFRVVGINNGSPNVQYDVHYKIGICPFTNGWDSYLESSSAGKTMQQIKTALTTSSGYKDKLQIQFLSVYVKNIMYGFSERFFGRQGNDYIIGGRYGIESSMILPIFLEDVYSSKIYGLAYLKLYYDNGATVTDSINANTYSRIMYYAKGSNDADYVNIADLDDGELYRKAGYFNLQILNDTDGFIPTDDYYTYT